MKKKCNVKSVMCKVFITIGILFAFNLSFAQENPSSSELISKAWDAQGKKEYDKVFEYTELCVSLYKQEADNQHKEFSEYPTKEILPLSDVAVAYFIQGEAFMRQGKFQEAQEKFQYVIDNYSYSVAWDPSRGVYWKVAGVSRESIDKIKGEIVEEVIEQPKLNAPKTQIVLYDPGHEDVVDYEKYGEFSNIGSKEYKYVIRDQDGLARAVGEGIYPNTTSVRWDPNFKKVVDEKRIEGSHWDFVHSPDLEASFLKWATASESEGVKMFFTGLILEKAGLLKHALKAYYSIIVHFPKSVGWTYWHTPWYVGPAAIAKINYILRRNPELGLKLCDARIRVVNGYDNTISNDIVITNPGKFEKVSKVSGLINSFRKRFFRGRMFGRNNKIVKRLGAGKVRLVGYDDGSWQLLVDNKPFVIKGVTYAPTKVGQSPDEGTLGNWMEEDFNSNGKPDGPYESCLQDKPSKPIGDFQLMKEMGVNAIRLYHHPQKINKELLRDLYKSYGIRVMIGDFVGKYAVGSGAPWQEGTDYSNPRHKKNMLDSVARMVDEFKDEEFLLCWILGNENVYGVACNANKDPDSFFKFVNEAALLIKSKDKNHPVAIASGDLVYLDRFAKYCPDVDIFGTNAYRGNYGFGNLWQAVKDESGKAAFITEYGCPAYAQGMSLQEAEEAQAQYHRGAWEDIVLNTGVNSPSGMCGKGVASGLGAGNSIGGVIFEFIDEWWKAYEPYKHDTKGFFTGPFPDGFMHEEWLGVVSQGDGKNSPFKRHPRKSYYLYQQLWR